MSASEPLRGSQTDPHARATLEQRVDAAHARSSDLEAAEIMAPVMAVEPARVSSPAIAATVQQVRAQATQLAAHLQRQQVAVDHREAELNARMAEMENQVRGARLWLTERHLEIARQKSELERREAELAEREKRVSTHPVAAGRASVSGAGDGSYPGSDHSARQRELDQRQRELDEMAARLADRLMQAEQAGDVDQSMRAIEARRESLERVERLLASDQAECERQRRQLALERDQFSHQIQNERQSIAEERRRAMSENEKVRTNLARQADELSARQATLERVRAEVARGQQEALEIRLATEELWSRLCGAMAPAALTQSLAQIRLKLAEEQRLARSEAAQQTSELQALSARVAEQHKKLCQEREELQGWANTRQQQLEKQASLLVTQEQQIEDERTKFDQARADWQSEKFRLQQEIRRLLRQSDLRMAAAA